MPNPILAPSWVLGLDVSHFQGAVDWNSLAQSGYKFAFIKATEGASEIDPEFSTNWSGAKSAGLIRGAYHYYDTGSDPLDQAEHFLSTVWPNGGQPLLAPGDLPPVLDFEQPNSQSSEEIINGIHRWLSLVRMKTLRIPILYTNLSSWEYLSTPQFGNHPLWIAEYQVAAPSALPMGWKQWCFWQFSSTGTLDEVSGPTVDIDVYQGDLQSLQQLASSVSMVLPQG